MHALFGFFVMMCSVRASFSCTVIAGSTDSCICIDILDVLNRTCRVYEVESKKIPSTSVEFIHCESVTRTDGRQTTQLKIIDL